jgi:hypothetical protein
MLGESLGLEVTSRSIDSIGNRQGYGQDQPSPSTSSVALQGHGLSQNFHKCTPPSLPTTAVQKGKGRGVGRPNPRRRSQQPGSSTPVQGRSRSQGDAILDEDVNEDDLMDELALAPANKGKEPKNKGPKSKGPKSKGPKSEEQKKKILRKDLPKDNPPSRQPHQETGLFFNSYHEATSGNHGDRRYDDAQYQPQTTAERQAWIKRLVKAFQNRDNIEDREGPVVKSRWIKKRPDGTLCDYYGADNIERVCWEILHNVMRMYEEGLDWVPVYDQETWNKFYLECDTGFKDRMEALIKLFTLYKNRCDKMMKGDNNFALLFAPELTLQTTRSNQKQNGVRQNDIEVGRKAQEKEDEEKGAAKKKPHGNRKNVAAKKSAPGKHSMARCSSSPLTAVIVHSQDTSTPRVPQDIAENDPETASSSHMTQQNAQASASLEHESRMADTIPLPDSIRNEILGQAPAPLDVDGGPNVRSHYQDSPPGYWVNMHAQQKSSQQTQPSGNDSTEDSPEIVNDLFTDLAGYNFSNTAGLDRDGTFGFLYSQASVTPVVTASMNEQHAEYNAMINPGLGEFGGFPSRGGLGSGAGPSLDFKLGLRQERETNIPPRQRKRPNTQSTFGEDDDEDDYQEHGPRKRLRRNEH